MAIAAERAVNKLEDKNKTLFTLFEKGYIVPNGEGRELRLKRIVQTFANQPLVSLCASWRLISMQAPFRKFSYTRSEVKLLV
jgi:hypothetical protein